MSMDSKGRALDNIFTERLWRSVKYAAVYLHEYTSPRDAQAGLDRDFTFYHFERLHHALGYATPASWYDRDPSRLGSPSSQGHAQNH
jgi:putative transposase